LPKVVNPLSVSVNSIGKERLIIYLWHVNKFLTLTNLNMMVWKKRKCTLQTRSIVINSI
jgi:hypothetical protein